MKLSLQVLDDELETDDKIRIKDGYPYFLIGKEGGYGMLQVKVDTTRICDRKAATRWVTYDSNSREVLSMSCRFWAVSAIQAEAIGLLKALTWAAGERVYHLNIGSDYLTLVLQIYGLKDVIHPLRWIIDDINCVMLNFNCVMLNFHCLAFTFVLGI